MRVPRRWSALFAPLALLLGQAASAQTEPNAAIYAARTPADTALTLPYSLLITPGDGQNTITLFQLAQPLPAHGTLSFPALYDGTPGQAFLYTPNAGYTGLDEFYYKVTDGSGDFSVAIVSINVGNVTAVAEDDTFVVGPEPDTFLDVLFNDRGFSDPVSFQVLTPPQHGTLDVVLPDPLWQGGIGLFYTAAPGYSGADSFTYQIGDGIDLDTATVTLSVAPDTDGDGVLDAEDNCPATANPGQQDGDNDGRGNACDNCTVHVNPAQQDTDGDGYGNRCDADFNNSGVVNATDLALFRNLFGTTNPLGDLNGSGGTVNAADLALFRSLFGLPPGPSGVVP